MSNCQLCERSSGLIQLICSHQICLKCTNQSKRLQQSQLQNKYWVQCIKCNKKTFSYDFSNLLIESHELSLLTDRSQHQFQLNESQLIMEPRMFQRRRSMNAIDLFAKNVSPQVRKSNTNKIPTKKSPDKKPQHKRCQTGIIENKKQSQMSGMLNFKLLTKQKTSPIQKCTSLFDYLLSLSYQQTKSENKNLYSKQVKNRCHSQMQIKQKIKN